MLHPIVINENGKRRTIYRKIWDVNYNKGRACTKAWIRYKRKELRVKLIDSEWRIDNRVVERMSGSPFAMILMGLDG